MAGVHAVLSAVTFSPNESWFRCADGQVIQAIDLIHLLFPNKGRSVYPGNVCFAPRRFSFPLLQSILPPPSQYFTPDDFIDGLLSLILLCSLVTVGMVVVKMVWNLVDPHFAAVNPPHKKWYIVANVSKAFFLGTLTLSTRFWVGMYNGYFNDDFQMTELKRTIMIYVATDLVALYMVPKLPRSTVLHHASTSVMAILTAAINLTVPGWHGFHGVFKMGVLYGMFSSIPFTVNAYLALRVVHPNSRLLRVLVHLALITYVVCCALNWGSHASWLVHLVANLQVSLFPLFYLVLIGVLINDDIILIRWLVRKSSPMASVDPKSE